MQIPQRRSNVTEISKFLRKSMYSTSKSAAACWWPGDDSRQPARRGFAGVEFDWTCFHVYRLTHGTVGTVYVRYVRCMRWANYLVNGSRLNKTMQAMIEVSTAGGWMWRTKGMPLIWHICRDKCGGCLFGGSVDDKKPKPNRVEPIGIDYGCEDIRSVAEFGGDTGAMR